MGAKRIWDTQMARVGFEPTPSLEDQQTRIDGVAHQYLKLAP
jgi:hypothetical protein